LGGSIGTEREAAERLHLIGESHEAKSSAKKRIEDQQRSLKLQPAKLRLGWTGFGLGIRVCLGKGKTGDFC